MQIRSQFESNTRSNPASSDCMSGAIRFNASSVTKNATSIALSYPQKRTARRVASNARLLLGKLSAIVVLSKLSPRCSIAQPALTTPQSAAQSGSPPQPCQIFAVYQNNGRPAEADGRSQRQAE